MKPPAQFIQEQASLMAEAERQGKDVGLFVSRAVWFYSEKSGVDYVKLAEAVAVAYYQDYRGSTQD